MKYDKDVLEKYILIDKLSYEKIGKLFGVSGASIKKAALRLGIKLPRRRTINEKETFNKGVIRCETGTCLLCGKEYIKYSEKKSEFCSSKCYYSYLHKTNYEKILNGDISIMRGNYTPRAFRDEFIKEQGGVCAICGCKPEHNGKPLVFIIDHIDGDASNNRRDNLRCICPNCDSQLDTFKSKNKNGTRSYYRYHRYENK